MQAFLLHGTKKYAAVLKLGEETDTQDFTGNIVSTAKLVDLSPKIIKDSFKRFEGSIEQLPPVYSALKHKGIPLYRLARHGKPMQKPPRCVQIYNLNVQEFTLPLIRFEVTCSAGTYIRTLCADIGKSLGCGGHLTALKRLESSGFTLNQAISMAKLEKLRNSPKLSEYIIPMTDALPNLPQVRADRQLAEKIFHGKMVSTRDLTGLNAIGRTHGTDSEIKVVDRDGDLIAILKYGKLGDHLDYRCVFPK